MPGIWRVPVPGASATGVAFAGAGGFGYTEQVLGDGDSHTRLSGSLAASARPVRWLAIGLRADGRYDSHSGNSGSDDGLVGDPRLLLRAGSTLDGGIQLGGQIGVWLPGKDAPSLAFDALSVDFQGLAAWAPASSPIALAATVGFRLDRSAATIEQADSLSRADRLALGVSEFNAVLLGVGVTYHTGGLELLLEGTWDVLVGAGAPGAATSPLRIAVGGRYGIGDTRALSLGLVAELSPSVRPNVDRGIALVPVDPLVSVTATLAYRFDFEHETATVETHDDGVHHRPITDRTPTPTTGVVRGQVTGEGGAAVANASVRLTRAGAALTELTTDAEGHFEAPSLPVGDVSVDVTAEGYQPANRTGAITAQTPLELAIALERPLPAGVLRGLIRSFDGSPLAATIRITELEREITANADGTFEVNVPPGHYGVVISARGHQEQRRSVRIEEQGVTVLNVDMRRGR